MVVISSGGELVERARAAGVPHLSLPPGLPPRASLGHGVGVLCALLERVGDPGLAHQVPEAVAVLESGSHRWGLVGEPTDDALEILARRLDGRLPVLWSGCRLTHAVARRWRAQINENSKLLVSTAELPELDHNEVVGWGQATAAREQVRVVALRDESEHARVALRFAATREALGLDVEAWSERHAQPGGPLARMMGLVQEGDVLSCLLAREASVEPVAVEVIDRIKRALGDR
jgi:glucose/mannose-6-phosphate isomerase